MDLLKMKEELLNILNNSFEKTLQLDVVDLKIGEVVFAMLVREELANPWKTVHGGILATLADISLGVSCASLGRTRLVTLNLDINYISDAKIGETVKSFAKVLHGGKSTMVAETQLKVNDRLIAAAKGTFFVLEQEDKQ